MTDYTALKNTIAAAASQLAVKIQAKALAADTQAADQLERAQAVESLVNALSVLFSL